MIKLNILLEGIDYEEILGDPGIEIVKLESDSRKVSQGSMFIAIRGTAYDGHQFIDSAISDGAVAVLCETLPGSLKDNVSYIRVRDSCRVLGMVASAFWGHPSRKLKLTGITGTNGKTTTATLLYRLFRGMGRKSGLISTISYLVDDRKLPASHTTPDSLTINRLLYEMVEEGCEHCFIEVSSHAIVQQRIGGLSFAGGIFTNISHDHLDYHRSYDEYLRVKKKFFDELGEDAFALVNKDDRNADFMVQNTRARVSSYALKSMADFRGSIIERHPDGMLLNVNGRELWTNFIGTFNASNLLAVFAGSRLLGAGEDEVLRILSALTPVEGRFETIRSPEGLIAIVDYAHTPDALENVIEAVRQLPGPGSRLITVTGAGGDRDRAKRPVMAKIASEKSDKLILTADNPRSENPESIIKDMLEGVDKTFSDRVLCISSRKEAIRTACMIAKPGDFILIAGKGHETYQEIMGVKHHFDDREIVRDVFNVMQNTR